MKIKEDMKFMALSQRIDNRTFLNWLDNLILTHGFLKVKII